MAEFWRDARRRPRDPATGQTITNRAAAQRTEIPKPARWRSRSEPSPFDTGARGGGSGPVAADPPRLLGPGPREASDPFHGAPLPSAPPPPAEPPGPSGHPPSHPSPGPSSEPPPVAGPVASAEVLEDLEGPGASTSSSGIAAPDCPHCAAELVVCGKCGHSFAHVSDEAATVVALTAMQAIGAVATRGLDTAGLPPMDLDPKFLAGYTAAWKAFLSKRAGRVGQFDDILAVVGASLVLAKQAREHAIAHRTKRGAS